VIAVEGLAQEFAVEVGIDLGGGNAFVAEHFLDGAEVGAAFHEVGGERMTEGMRGDIFCDTGLPDQVFEEQEDHLPRKLAAPSVEKEGVFMTGFCAEVDADILLIDADIFDGGAADGYQSFLIAFADHADVAHVQVEAGDPEVDDFTDAQTAAVHGFEDGLIAPAFGLAEVDTADDVFDLIEAEDIRKGSFEFRGFQKGCRILPDDLFDETIFIKGPDTGEDTGLGGGVEAQLCNPVKEFL
jgi:hypothetical protein